MEQLRQQHYHEERSRETRTHRHRRRAAEHPQGRHQPYLDADSVRQPADRTLRRFTTHQVYRRLQAGTEV